VSPRAMGQPALAEHHAARPAKEEASPELVRAVSRRAPVWAEVPKLWPLHLGRGVFRSRVSAAQREPLF